MAHLTHFMLQVHADYGSQQSSPPSVTSSPSLLTLSQLLAAPRDRAVFLTAVRQPPDAASPSSSEYLIRDHAAPRTATSSGPPATSPFGHGDSFRVAGEVVGCVRGNYGGTHFILASCTPRNTATADQFSSGASSGSHGTVTSGGEMQRSSSYDDVTRRRPQGGAGGGRGSGRGGEADLTERRGSGDEKSPRGSTENVGAAAAGEGSSRKAGKMVHREKGRSLSVGNSLFAKSLSHDEARADTPSRPTSSAATRAAGSAAIDGDARLSDSVDAAPRHVASARMALPPLLIGWLPAKGGKGGGTGGDEIARGGEGGGGCGGGGVGGRGSGGGWLAWSARRGVGLAGEKDEGRTRDEQQMKSQGEESQREESQGAESQSEGVEGVTGKGKAQAAFGLSLGQVGPRPLYTQTRFSVVLKAPVWKQARVTPCGIATPPPQVTGLLAGGSAKLSSVECSNNEGARLNGADSAVCDNKEGKVAQKLESSSSRSSSFAVWRPFALKDGAGVGPVAFKSSFHGAALPWGSSSWRARGHSGSAEGGAGGEGSGGGAAAAAAGTGWGGVAVAGWGRASGSSRRSGWAWWEAWGSGEAGVGAYEGKQSGGAGEAGGGDGEGEESNVCGEAEGRGEREEHGGRSEGAAVEGDAGDGGKGGVADAGAGMERAGEGCDGGAGRNEGTAGTAGARGAGGGGGSATAIERMHGADLATGGSTLAGGPELGGVAEGMPCAKEGSACSEDSCYSGSSSGSSGSGGSSPGCEEPDDSVDDTACSHGGSLLRASASMPALQGGHPSHHAHAHAHAQAPPMVLTARAAAAPVIQPSGSFSTAAAAAAAAAASQTQALSKSGPLMVASPAGGAAAGASAGGAVVGACASLGGSVRGAGGSGSRRSTGSSTASTGSSSSGSLHLVGRAEALIRFIASPAATPSAPTAPRLWTNGARSSSSSSSSGGGWVMECTLLAGLGRTAGQGAGGGGGSGGREGQAGQGGEQFRNVQLLAHVGGTAAAAGGGNCSDKGGYGRISGSGSSRRAVLEVRLGGDGKGEKVGNEAGPAGVCVVRVVRMRGGQGEAGSGGETAGRSASAPGAMTAGAGASATTGAAAGAGEAAGGAFVLWLDATAVSPLQALGMCVAWLDSAAARRPAPAI
ncbi:hypothetical protein CLOM_g5120 [Closterium sp. NIES-68]|nr:hypothetical protein CLOM_g5120 [Closterium sp. NIES-68]